VQILQGVKRVLVREAVLHCAAVPSGWYYNRTEQEAFDEIKRWHIEKGWKNIGYHYVIHPSGHVMSGRPLDEVGAHVIGHNYGKLAILMIELSKIDRIGKFSDFFSVRQKESVRRLCGLHQIKIISGHNNYAPKLCPGFNVRADDFLGYS